MRQDLERRDERDRGRTDSPLRPADDAVHLDTEAAADAFAQRAHPAVVVDASKVVVDDWGQARAGSFGALRAHVDSGRLDEESLHAELCQIVVGDRPGRESDDERILFWHRGLSLSDIALGAALVDKARRLGIGTTLELL